MTNPFEAFDISDDEEDQFVGNKTDKVRKTHKERRELKKQGTEAPKTTATTEPLNTEVPARVRDNAKEIRHNRQGRPEKGVPAGHPLDRRSGTGREDRPRKQGGGRGNIGNVHDELNKEKYQKPEEVPATVGQQAPQQPPKPEQPQKLTLAEYYQSKGVDLTLTAGQRKAPVKTEVSAEWLKKEKLTLVETKEDKKRQEVVKQNITQHNNTKVEMDFGNSEILGFGTKPAQKPREEEQRNHQERGHKGGKKTHQKVVLNDDDFPTL